MNEKCWNCGSDRYYQTASIEHCPDCGIHCDYHGEGTNEEYKQAMKKNYAKEQQTTSDQDY